MRRKIAAWLILAWLSSEALANDEIFDPIPCEVDEGKMLVQAMVNEESGATYKESLRAAGTKLNARLLSVLENRDNAASSIPYQDIQFLLKKASCIREVATGMNVSDEFISSWKRHIKEIESKSGRNFLRMPGNPKTALERNLVNNYRLVYYNRDAFAFARVMFE